MHDTKSESGAVEKLEAEDAKRRSIALALFGALGGTLLPGCVAGSDSEQDIGRLPQDLTAASVLVAVNVAGLRTLSGIANATQVTIAFAEGYSTASDGGGGVFYWSTTAQADDGWSALNLASGNSAGWRRINPGFVAVDNVTALRTTAGSPKRVAFLAGRAGADDGGGGTFHWSNTAALDDGTTILNAGGLGTSSAGWRRDYVGPINVKWFGATGDGVTYDHVAINAAIAALPATGGEVWLPAGTYLVGAPIVINNRAGVRLRGAGKYSTRILADAGVMTVAAGTETTGAIVKFTNCELCAVEDLRIASKSPAAASPPSCIESRRDSLLVNCSALTVKDCILGSDDGFFNLDGIRYTCSDAAHDGNNENGTFVNVFVTGLLRAALSIEHSNSLAHHWFGGNVYRCAHFVRLRGGSFSAHGASLTCGAVLYSIGGGGPTALVDFGTPTFNGVGGYHGFYDHSSGLYGCAIEGVDQLITTDTFPTVQMVFHGGGVEGAGTAAGAYVIDFNSTVGADLVRPQVTFDNFTLICGGATVPARVTAPGSVLTIKDCTGIGITAVSFAGTFIHHNNRWLPGSPAFTPSDGAFELYYAEIGGGFVQKDFVIRTRTAGAWAPAGLPYTLSNHSDSRTLNETGATLTQVANVLGTLIKDLQASGHIK